MKKDSFIIFDFSLSRLRHQEVAPARNNRLTASARTFTATLFIALLCFAQQGFAAGRASEILEKLAAGFRAQASYSVRFGVQAEEHAVTGRYDVRGEGYYMLLGEAEVYSDGKTRYEVDNRRREVTVTEIDAGSRNILNNPVHAFDFLGSQYTPSLLSESDGRAVVHLIPVAEGGALVGAVTVTVDTATMRPMLLTYDFDGQRIDVTVYGIASLTSPLKTFEKSAYAGYEFIDFR